LKYSATFPTFRPAPHLFHLQACNKIHTRRFIISLPPVTAPRHPLYLLQYQILIVLTVTIIATSAPAARHLVYHPVCCTASILHCTCHHDD
jgi:hypothetical protein